MNFHTKMLTFSGGALIIAMLFCLILTGWNIAKSADQIHKDVQAQFFEQMQNASASDISAKAYSLENEYAAILNRLETVMLRMENQGDPEPNGSLAGLTFPGDTIFFGECAGKKIQLLLPKEKTSFLPLKTIPDDLRKAAGKIPVGNTGFFLLPEKENGICRLLQVHRKKDSIFAAACAVDLRKQLSDLCASPKIMRLALIAGKLELGIRGNDDISSRIRHGMLAFGSRFAFPHNSRISNAEILLDEQKDSRKAEHWIISGTGLRIPVFSGARLSLVQAAPCSQSLSAVLTSPFAKLMFMEILTIFAGTLFLLLVWIILIRKTSFSLKTLLHKANKITRGDLPGIDCTDSTFEFSGISGALTHLSDKLIGMRMRLKKSHEREMLARKDAEESNRTKALLLDEMVSDLAEPLNLISGFSGLLLRTADPKSETGDVLRKIYSEAQSASRKIQSLKSIVLLDSSDAEPVYSEFDIDELITSLPDATREAVSRNHIHFEIHSSEISGKIVSDKSILSAILTLAADTILLYAAPHSRLIISFRELDRKIEVRISDSPKTDRVSPAQIFNEYRIAPESAYVPPGYGNALLNLEVISTKAKLLGASFETSVSQTENSIFTIRFLRDGHSGSEPASPLGTSSNSTHTSFSVQQNKVRKIYLSGGRVPSILVADSSASAVTMFSMMLEQEHYKTDSAFSPDAVLMKLQKHHYDLLLLDLNLQRGHCLELLHAIRTGISDSIVILTLSSELAPDEKTELRNAGADRTLLKPVRMDELADTIRELTVS